MRRIIAFGAAIILVLATGSAFAQGVAPGGPIGGSTGIGSGLGGNGGTGPSWPNGTNQAPQPSIPSVPPGGYASPAPPSTYTPSRPAVAPSTAGSGSTYRHPNEPFSTSTPRPPATIPLEVPAQPTDSVAFAKGCWRSDNFAWSGHRGTVTWCLDDKGVGRFLYTRTDAANVYFCHAEATAKWEDKALHLVGPKPTCDGGGTDAPADLTCRNDTDGALCSDPAKSWTVRLYRVR